MRGVGGGGGSHQVRILSIKFVKNPLMNAKTIFNLISAANFLMPVEKIPLELRIIILKFSGHIKVGNKSIQFVVY
jgi:hypothetical protein